MEVKQLYDSNGEPFYPKTAASPSGGGLIGGVEGDGILVFDAINNRAFINGINLLNILESERDSSSDYYITEESRTNFFNIIANNIQNINICYLLSYNRNNTKGYTDYFIIRDFDINISTKDISTGFYDTINLSIKRHFLYNVGTSGNKEVIDIDLGIINFTTMYHNTVVKTIKILNTN